MYVCMYLTQVMYGVFLLFCPIGEAISQTVQAYMPTYTVKRKAVVPGGKSPRVLTFGKASSAVGMLKLLGGVAAGLGVANAFAATSITSLIPFMFTPDPLV
ncbi:unnamed protein product, partial [Choristocarpus tenellus]